MKIKRKVKRLSNNKAQYFTIFVPSFPSHPPLHLRLTSSLVVVPKTLLSFPSTFTFSKVLGILYFVLGGVASQTFTVKRSRLEPYIREAIVWVVWVERAGGEGGEEETGQLGRGRVYGRDLFTEQLQVF